MRAGESCWVAGFGSFYDASTITNANASILEPDIYGYENRFGEIETKTIADRDCRRSNVSSSGFRYGQMFCSGSFTIMNLNIEFQYFLGREITKVTVFRPK